MLYRSVVLHLFLSSTTVNNCAFFVFFLFCFLRLFFFFAFLFFVFYATRFRIVNV